MGSDRPITVLVADDSASLRSLVRITVTSQGWHVIEAETTKETLAVARTSAPDLIILDITFGDDGPDGLAVCAELRADPATQRIPIVILTAHDDPAQKRRAEAAGASAFVAKPFGPLDLMSVLRDLLPAAQATPSLGVLLLDAGAVEPVVLERALIEQRELAHEGRQKRLGDVLLERGSVSSAALDRALLEQMHARSFKTGRTRILVIDDHAAVREGLKALIRDDDALEVVGEAADAAEGLRLARRHRPELIVLDNEMPGGSGVDLVRPLRRDLPDAKIVMFSLDSSIRDRALSNGAHTFLAKDAPMSDILDALHSARSAAPVEDSSITLPPMRLQRGLRRAVLVIAAVLAAYVPAFLILESAVDASAGVLGMVPAVLIGGLLGPEAGSVGAALVVAVTFILWNVTGHEVGETVVTIGQGSGAAVLIILGFVAGALRLMGLRADPHRRRVDAIADASRALAGLGRVEFVESLLEAMLRVTPGDVSMLFSNAAGDARFVSASRAVEPEFVDRIVPPVRDVMRAAMPRTTDLDDDRSAVVVPVSVPGQDVRGALVLIGKQGAFSAADIAVLRSFAHQLWLVLRSGPIEAHAGVLGAARERAG